MLQHHNNGPIRVIAPVDPHIHLRNADDPQFQLYVKRLYEDWAAILPMPNTKPPITTGSQAMAYAEAIRQAGFKKGLIIPTIKLTMSTTVETIREASECGVRAAKFYPRGMTTNASDGFGPENFRSLDSIYAEMERCGMHLLLHGEMPGVDNMTREIKFLVELNRIAESFPKLKITLEHITTAEAVARLDDLYQSRGNITATITAHHLVCTLDHILDGWPNGPRGLNPHNYCKPVPKSESDRRELIGAIKKPWARFGSDSAPHQQENKESACGCAGVYTAPIAIPLMYEILEQYGLTAEWPQFMRWRAWHWFGLEQRGEPKMLTIKREPWLVPDRYDGVVPFKAGQELQWQIAEE